MVKFNQIESCGPLKAVQCEIVGRDFELLAKHMMHCDELHGHQWARRTTFAWGEVQDFCQKRMVTSTGMAAGVVMAMSWVWGG